MAATMMHVACAADATYAPHCATMIASLLDHCDPSALCVQYLHPEDLPAATLADLRQMTTIRGAGFRSHAFADGEIAGLPSWPGVRPVMWYRVLLPERLAELDKVLYIDADAIVLDDLRPLWDTDLAGAPLAAVTNVLAAAFAGHAERLGLPDAAAYFNSGVMLLNLARLRDENSCARLIEYGRSHRLRFWDQDALNVFFHRERRALHPRWNCLNGMFLFPAARKHFGSAELEAAKARPAIVHFEGPGPGKPWHYLSKHPYQRDYLRYRAQTPWPLHELEGRTLRNRVLRLLPTPWILAAIDLEHRARRWLRRLAS
jgi:lipopolysaccharide biosynthesis glycosyltransferase